MRFCGRGGVGVFSARNRLIAETPPMGDVGAPAGEALGGVWAAYTGAGVGAGEGAAAGAGSFSSRHGIWWGAAPSALLLVMPSSGEPIACGSCASD